MYRAEMDLRRCPPLRKAKSGCDSLTLMEPLRANPQSPCSVRTLRKPILDRAGYVSAIQRVAVSRWKRHRPLCLVDALGGRWWRG